MSVWLPSAPCTAPRCLAGPAPTVAGPRRAVRYAALLSVLTCGVLLSPVAGALPAGLRDRLTARWSRALVAALGVRVRITGGDTERTASGALVVANHVSWLDIPLIAAARPGRMLAKAEIAHYPVLGRLAARGGTLFVDRARLRALPGTVGEIGSVLRTGRTVVAFPEGSTWCGRRHGRFRNAVFQAALDASAPVQPVAVRYRLLDRSPTAVPAFIGEDTLLTSVRRVARSRGLVAELVLLPRIPAGAYPDRRALARAAHAAVRGVTEGPRGDWGVPGDPHPDDLRPGDVSPGGLDRGGLGRGDLHPGEVTDGRVGISGPDGVLT
ncbi:lysophospholipid acyltransferase family protein [Streptomyces sp. NPDC002055]|uniref:lysophospholipid acyltransferase family protein n=1 Tax=Streptomyces sp. NPDC002055 TaxID=3154534 RepID=UPI00332B4562